MTGDAFKLETFSDRVRSLVHGLWALYDGPSVLSGVGLHESPQSTLGLGAGEAIFSPRARTLPIFWLTSRPS